MAEGQKSYYSIKEHVNTFVLAVITLISVFMFVGYIGDFKKGVIGLGFCLLVEGFVILSMVADYVVYFRKKDGDLFRHVSLIGYIIMYALCVWGSHNDMVFCIAFPITVMYILYFDFRMILLGAIGFGAINLADMIYVVAIMKHMHSGAPLESTSLLIQGACVFVYLLVICYSTKISNKNNAIKMESLKAERNKSNELLKDVLKIASAVRENTQKASGFIGELGEDVDVTTSAMEEIAKGNNNNAENIEKQTVMTSNIQSMIEETKRMSDELLNLSRESDNAVQGGRESVQSLEVSAEKTGVANKQVEESVQAFMQNVTQVEEIVSQIFAISDQTNLLALNASIESARAGEAGKGFSVVAEAIRKLAEETRVLTEEIGHIVGVLQSNANNAIQTVGNVLDTAKDEHELIAQAQSRFEEIGDCMTKLNDNVTMIYRKIEEIMESNNVIVDSITQISAVSEEVAASTQQTVDKSIGTREKAESVERLMNNLVITVGTIDKYLDDTKKTD